MHTFSLGPIQPKKESYVKILRRTVIPLYYNLQSKGISMKVGNFKTKGAFQRLELPGQGPVS